MTSDARVRAHHVVLAGNIHLANLMPQFAKTLMPVHTYVIVTAPLGRRCTRRCASPAR